MLIKKGDATEIRVRDYSSVQSIINPEIIADFTKQAKDLKKIAPKADDFLYFSTVMMHAAEAACINEDGSAKLYRGKPVTSSWDETTGSYIWKCSDPNIQPYRNQRGDIFPEAELIKAHKEWVGKPLCIDHQASSVDHTRGFIVDTFYDYDLKRIVALAAIDKRSYPELARKVETGASNNVSMGTGVGRAVCTEKGCHRVIKSANEFCEHMKYKSGYGEVNLDLSPIELSIVVAGADKRAKIKHIIASVDALNKYVKSKEDLLKKGSSKDLDFTSTILEDLRAFVDSATEKLEDLKTETSSIEEDEDALIDSELETEEDPSGELLSAPAGARMADELVEMKKAASLLESRLQKMHKKVSDISLKSLMKSASELYNKVCKAEAEDLYSAHLQLRGEDGVNRNLEINTNKLSELESFLDTSCEELKELQGHSSDLEDSDSNKKEAFVSLTDNIETKISSLQQQFSNLVKGYNMTIDKKAYFQGGGGVNEPTPGKQKYPVDPMNDKLRQDDHHMKGQKPFPEVGDVEKLYGDDLEKKKKLSRAEEEQDDRAIKRAVALEAAREALKKSAYYQGGGGVNEPTPGKQKYPVDPMNDKLRQEDHHMKGQKPFPEVGDVEKLYGDDLEKKKKLSRASKLKGSLIKGASLGEYTWKVTDTDGNVLFKDTVANLTRGDELLYSAACTEEYGHGLINRVQKQAFTKMAQDTGAAAPAMPAEMPMPAGAPAGDPGVAPAPAPEAAPEGGTGDVKETALTLAEQVRDLSSDLVEAVQNLTGEQEEAGEVVPKAASALHTIQREANAALTDVITEMVEDLSDRKDELTQITGMISAGKVNAANADIFQSISQASFDETKKAIAQGRALMGTFLKYARGAQALIKQAEMEEELAGLESGGDFEDDGESLSDVLDRVDTELDDVDTVLNQDTQSSEDMDMDDEDTLSSEDMDMDDEDSTDELESDDLDLDAISEDLDLEESAEDSVDSDFDALLADMVEVKTPDGKTVKAPPGSEVRTVSASRNEMRAKIAAKAMQLSGVAGELADSTTIGGIDGTGDSTVSENIVDQQEKTMSLVLGKVKVRKEAEKIHQLISQGEIAPSDLDSLVSLGVDPEAVKYYKEFYGQAEGGKEFAAELTSESKKSEASEEVEAFKVKIARAYELVHDMVSKDLCPDDRDSISSKVNEVVQFNDSAFDSLKRIVASAPTPVRKVASLPVSGLMPQVGVINEGSKTKGSGNSSVDVYMEALQGGRSSRFSR